MTRTQSTSTGVSKPADRARPRTAAPSWVIAERLGPVAISVGLGAIALLLGAATARQGAVALIAFGVAVACVFPEACILCAIAWIALCRPGQELVRTRVAGNVVTEIDILVVLALVAAVAWVVREKPTFPWPRTALLAFVWPAFFVVRALLPVLGPHTLLGPVAVDLRLVEAYVLVTPAIVIARRRGLRRLVQLLVVVGLLASLVAIAAWLGERAGALAPHEWSVVNISASAARDVRPGGELVVCIAAVLLLLGPFVQSAVPRALALALIVGELAVSKTLSMVLAVGVGSAAVLALGWRTLRPALRAGMVGVALVVLVLGLGVVDPGGRYDVRGRVDETSGQYRAAELDVVSATLGSAPLTAVMGAGVGTEFTFGDQYVHEVKRDTHSTYLNVAAKTGLAGLVLFILPFVVVGFGALRRGGAGGRAMTAALVAVAILSLSVPFSWTVPGLTAALVLLVAASAASMPGTAPEGRP